MDTDLVQLYDQALLHLGWEYEQLGDYDAAIQAYEKCLAHQDKLNTTL